MTTLQIDSDITRIDIERTGHDLWVRMWKRGWRIDGGTAPISDEFFPGSVTCTIESLLAECSAAGFTVEMADHWRGRALRGEITRVDFINGKIRKYPFGWTAKTFPISDKPASAEEIATAIQWCKDHGWTVYEWPGGARAWRGPAMPVYDAHTIQSIRRVVNRDPHDPRRRYDLAYYF